MPASTMRIACCGIDAPALARSQALCEWLHVSASSAGEALRHIAELYRIRGRHPWPIFTRALRAASEKSRPISWADLEPSASENSDWSAGRADSSRRSTARSQEVRPFAFLDCQTAQHEIRRDRPATKQS